MNKITRVLLIAAGLSASLTAAAAGTAIVSGNKVTMATNCTLLGEDVTLNLSNNVHGAYKCDPVNIDIRVATCHVAGSRKATTVTCVSTGTNTDGTPAFNDPACTKAGDTWQLANFRAFTGSSRGGSIGISNLGDGKACDDTTIAGHAWLN